MAIESIIKTEYPLKQYTHFNIGGSAEYFALVKTRGELTDLCGWAKEKGCKIRFLGGGSNVLVADGLIEGLVVKMGNNSLKIMNQRLKAGAGASLAQASSLAYQNSLSGLEWSTGIPRATIGGAVRGNAGAFSESIGALVETVESFNVKTMSFETLSRAMCRFCYRGSLFKEDPDILVWEAVLKLDQKDPADILKKIEQSIQFRSKNYPKLPSAGSVFKNIEPGHIKDNNPELFERELKDRVGREGLVSAGLVIDMLGLKGKSIGGAKISLEHANHIVNTGSATADDVASLISYIKNQVRNKLKIQLREEVVYFGF